MPPLSKGNVHRIHFLAYSIQCIKHISHSHTYRHVTLTLLTLGPFQNNEQQV